MPPPLTFNDSELCPQIWLSEETAIISYTASTSSLWKRTGVAFPLWWNLISKYYYKRFGLRIVNEGYVLPSGGMFHIKNYWVDCNKTTCLLGPTSWICGWSIYFWSPSASCSSTRINVVLWRLWQPNHHHVILKIFGSSVETRYFVCTLLPVEWSGC